MGAETAMMKIKGRRLLDNIKSEVRDQQKVWGQDWHREARAVEYPDYSCWVDSDADDGDYDDRDYDDDDRDYDDRD